MPGPLEGYRVLEMSQIVTGPLAAMLLADQGADVISMSIGWWGYSHVVAEAVGQTGLFNAILREYLLAPEVTSRRLYLETMEEILPKAEKVVLEPGMTDIVPYLPVGPAGRPVGSLVRPGSGTKPEKGAAE